MILKLGMKHQGEELYKVYINHDLGMTLTYFIYPSSQVSVYRTIGPLVIINCTRLDIYFQLLGILRVNNAL